MALPQLKLVTDPAPGFNPESADPTRRIFEHWLFMAGRSPRRCKMGPTRRQAIDGALAMGYDEDTLLAAVEGMSADPLDDVPVARMRDAMREIEWLLAREARIERWAEAGDQLRQRAVQAQADAARPAHDAPPTDEDRAAAAAAKDRLRALADRLRKGVR